MVDEHEPTPAEIQAEMERLRDAVRSSRQITVATGVVMTALRCSSDQAFAVLAEASVRADRSLCDVADEVVRTGELP